MRIEHIGIRPIRPEQQLENLIRVLGVLEPGPEVQPPADAPAGGVVAANLQRLADRRRQLGRVVYVDLIARIQAVQVGDVAMMDVARLHVPVFEPLLKLAFLADLVRRQAGPRRLDLVAELSVHIENRRGVNAVREQIAKDLAVHRRPGTDRDAIFVPILRRQRWACDQPLMLRFFHKCVEEELARPFQRWIDLREEGPVAAELVVVPQVLAQPRAARRPEAPERAVDRPRSSPQVRVMVADPAACAPVDAGGPGAGLGQVHHHRDQRLDALAQGRRLGGPVVHLRVDVDRVLAAPGRTHAVVPDALEVGRLCARPGAGDQQVASELEVQRR